MLWLTSGGTPSTTISRAVADNNINITPTVPDINIIPNRKGLIARRNVKNSPMLSKN